MEGLQRNVRLQPLPFHRSGLHILLLSVLSVQRHGPRKRTDREARTEGLELHGLPVHPQDPCLQVHNLRGGETGNKGGVRPQVRRYLQRGEGEVLPPREGPHGGGCNIRCGQISHGCRHMQDPPRQGIHRRPVQITEHEPQLEGHEERLRDRHDPDAAIQGIGTQEPGPSHEPDPAETQEGHHIPGHRLREALCRLRC